MPTAVAKKRRNTAKHAPRPAPALATEAWPLKETREEWLRKLRAEYTPEVCAQTLALNDSLPIHGEP